MEIKNVVYEECENSDWFLSHSFSKKSLNLLEQNMVLMKCKKENYVFYEGSPVNGIFFVLSGKVKILKSGINGKQQIIRLAKPGDILGYRGLGGNNIYPVGAETIEDSQVYFLETKIFFEILRNDPEFSIRLVLFYAEELKVIESRLRDQAQMTAREKVADSLLIIFNAYGLDEDHFLNVQLSRKDIANIAGTNNEQVSRFLSEFEKEKIIELVDKKIKIGSLSGLKKMIAPYHHSY